MIDVVQLKKHIIVPALSEFDLLSDNAVYLLLGTAAQESHMGTYLVQNSIGIRGGIGIYQMEENTYEKLWNKHISNSILIKNRIKNYFGYSAKPSAIRMISDLGLATLMCRIFYYDIKEKLPDYKNIEAMAAYWKKYYNTVHGKGNEKDFIANYKRYVD